MTNKLPKEWCIKVTEENLEVLNEWRTHHTLTENQIGGFLLYPGCENAVGYYVEETIFSQISFDEFKKYVLNQEVVEIQEDYSYLNELFKKLNIK